MSAAEKDAFVAERLALYNRGKRDAVALMRDFAARFKGVDGEAALCTLADSMAESLDKLEAVVKS